MFHVDYGKAESNLHFGKHQSGAVKRTGEHCPQWEVEGTGAAFVGREDQEWLRRSVYGGGIELDLRDPRTRPTNVTRWRVLEQVLTGAVEALCLCHISSRAERLPRQVVNRSVSLTVAVNHEQADIVSGVSNVEVSNEAAFPGCGEMFAGTVQHGLRRSRVTADAPHVGFDRTDGKHANPPSTASRAAPGRGRRGKTTVCIARGSLLAEACHDQSIRFSSNTHSPPDSTISPMPCRR